MEVTTTTKLKTTTSKTKDKRPQRLMWLHQLEAQDIPGMLHYAISVTSITQVLARLSVATVRTLDTLPEIVESRM